MAYALSESDRRTCFVMSGVGDSPKQSPLIWHVICGDLMRTHPLPFDLRDAAGAHLIPSHLNHLVRDVVWVRDYHIICLNRGANQE